MRGSEDMKFSPGASTLLPVAIVGVRLQEKLGKDMQEEV